MAVSMKIRGTGLWKWFLKHGTAVRIEIIAEIAARAQYQAWSEWSTRKGDESLGIRFEHRGFGQLGLTPRSLNYREKQYKSFGQTLPYVGPRGSFNALALAKAIAKSKWNTREVILSGMRDPRRSHARDVVKMPRSGFNVKLKGQRTVVKTVYTLPGMKIINRIAPPRGPVYRREFLQFEGRGRRDAIWINRRANELMVEGLTMALTAAGVFTIDGTTKRPSAALGAAKWKRNWRNA
jgi:hypothetical protein